VRGKFAYISPEQARNETIDPRSDVFSVGILMWELICNRRLFSGLDDMAALRAVRDAKVPQPTEIDGRLPPEIDQILMTALAKDTTQRYTSSRQRGQKLRSLRYSLDVSVGDPSSELAKLIESTEEVERQSQQMIAQKRPGSGRFDFDGGEATVIRIRTADAFSARDNDQSISQARMVIDRFEEEETRLANLSSDQMRMLRNAAPVRESSELTSESAPMRRARRDSEEEMTRAREPLDLGKLASYEQPFDTPGDDTRLIAPRDRRTPTPGVRTASPPRANRPSTIPPPSPSRGRGPTPGPPLPGMPPPMQLPSTPSPAPAPAMQPMPQPPQPMPPTLPMGMNNAMPPQGAPPFVPSQPAGGYQGWGAPIAPQRPVRDATPTAQDSFDQPVFPNRPSMPQVAGFQRPRKQGIKPWVLVIGALIMAALAFAITRAFIS
jgi:serine/threonine-protein kinase